MEKINYNLAKIRGIFWGSIRKLLGHRKFKRKRYYGKSIKGIEDANKLIYKKLESGEPFLAARFGDAELRALMYTLENKLGIREGFPEYIKSVMQLNAGFFPATDDNLLRFGETLLAASKNVDIFGVWFNLMEDYVIHTYDKDAELVQLEALEPYRSKQPWSKALFGKKVLVVHPFSESIEHQYKKADKLFENKDVLPKFKLITYKTVQTNAGGQCDYEDWFQALDIMFEDIRKIDFDIAIVGCGSYGLPLSARIKSLNKQVIHLAGATQILFGIRGSRWDVRPEMQKFFNEFWTRPLESERPKDANKVEGGCYW